MTQPSIYLIRKCKRSVARITSDEPKETMDPQPTVDAEGPRVDPDVVGNLDGEEPASVERQSTSTRYINCYNGCMAKTLTIRLAEKDREVLEVAARRNGTGLSTFVRALAEAEARRLRREEIRADGERVVSYLEHHPRAQAELETYGVPIGNGR